MVAFHTVGKLGYVLACGAVFHWLTLWTAAAWE